MLRNHSSTVTRAIRPATATCTALRIRSMLPRGSGRMGSIHPWALARAATEPARAKARSAVRLVTSMASILGETGGETAIAGGFAQLETSDVRRQLSPYAGF